MRALVFINGVISDLEVVRGEMRPDDLLVAADGGARYLLALDLIPHLLVGDLDSVEADDLAHMVAAGVTILRSPVHKDETDLELAIGAAIEAGADEIVLVGATGGRLDQTLANLLILAQREWGATLQILDGDQRALLLRGPATQQIAGEIGALVSAIPLSAQVTGITYTGLAYPLTNHTLTLGSTRAVSNELAAPEASVVLDSGLLLLIVGNGARFIPS